MNFEIDTVNDTLRIQAKKGEDVQYHFRKALGALSAELSDYHRCPYHSGKRMVSYEAGNSVRDPVSAEEPRSSS